MTSCPVCGAEPATQCAWCDAIACADERCQVDAHGGRRECPQRPKLESWLYKNPEALASVQRGLKDSAAGRVHDLGSFAKHGNKSKGV